MFKKLLFGLVFSGLYLFSLLPWSILYVLSDTTALLLGKIIGYRRSVVMANLALAFPEKTTAERQLIANKFYRNFCDNWIETLKLLSISKKSFNRRVKGNFEIFDHLYAKGVAVQTNLGHFFNWEYMTLHTGLHQPYPFLTVYLPQSNALMDHIIFYIRSRWGNPQIPATKMAKAMIPWRKKQYLLALGADQSPADPQSGYWLNFMGQPAPFPKGPEKYARGQNIPVVMMTTTRPKRGHYHFDYFMLTDAPQLLPEGELMRKYVRQLEENIRLQPDLYLWSHRRWKHSWKKEYAHIWVDDQPAPATNPK